MDKKTIYPVKVDAHIHEIQAFQMMHSPKMILDFAHYLKEYARENKMPNVMVKARVSVDFNQRKAVEVFSSDIDLTQENWNYFAHNEWINPLK